MIYKLKQYIIAGISLLIGAFLPYLYSFADIYSKNAQILIYIASIALFLLGLLIITWIQYQHRTHRVKYSVLIFAVNEQNKLLTTYNPYHHRLMIPCGVLPANLTPNETVHRFLKEQTGLEETDYQNIRFQSKKQFTVPHLCPVDTQIEFVTKHEKHVRLHYAFIYFIRVIDPSKTESSVSYMSIDEIAAMPPAEGLYSDLFARYRVLLTELEKGEQNA